MKVSTENDNNFGYEKNYDFSRQYPFNDTGEVKKNDIFFGLQREVTLSGNIFKINLETFSQILIFC